MPIIGSYRDVGVWLLSMDMVDEVWRRVRALPRDEFELKRQITGAAISIPPSVAEGWCRKHRRQAYQNHVSIAMGSSGELHTQLDVCFRNQLLRRDDCKQITDMLADARPAL